MALFQIKKNKAGQIEIDFTQFQNEAALRDFFSENLEELLGLRFLAKECPITGGRMDTLAVDETGTPVIIEYKWDAKDNILSQGLFYMDWLKENKRLFESVVVEKMGKNVQVSWDNPRLILIAQGFDVYTLAAARQVKNSIELIKYAPYGLDILHLETVYSSESIRPVSRTLQRKEKEEKSIYSVEHHLNKVDDKIREIFYLLQSEISKWSNVEERADQKVGITYRTTKSFVRFEFGKSYINILVRDSRYGHVIDPKKLLKDITSFQWGYKGLIKLKSTTDVQSALELIRMSYESTL